MPTYLVPDCNLAELETRLEKLSKRCVKLGMQPLTVTKQPDHLRYQVNQTQSGCVVNGPLQRLVWRKLGEGCTTIEQEKERCRQLAKETSAYLADQWEPTGVVMQYWAVTVEGEKPQLKDWAFVAILEPMQLEDGTVENLVSCLPGESCPPEYRSVIGRCDHCQTSRTRKQTFVVRSTETETKCIHRVFKREQWFSTQVDAKNYPPNWVPTEETRSVGKGPTKCVGRQCLKDFLGYHADPQSLASQAELLAELQGLCSSCEDEDFFGMGSGSSSPSAWDITKFMALTACRIRLFGWRSRTVAREDPYGLPATADMVLTLLNPPRTTDRDAYEKWCKLSNQHVEVQQDNELAVTAIEWAKAIPEDQRNDYLGNVNLVARMGYVERKTAGIAASILVAYNKAHEKEINRQKYANRPPSNHVGEVGKRIPYLRVTCEKIILNEGDFGVTGIHKLVDEAGNDLTWFASSGKVLTEGKACWIAGTVKEHSEYKGRPQTTLSRVTELTEEQVEQLKAKEARKAAKEAKKSAVS